MTDKPIMINGVDVAGCGYLGLYKECKLKCGSCCPVDCSDNPNCYYKQLAHKEQECEKAKQNAQDTYDLWQALIESFNILQNEKIKLEQENEELKNCLTEIKEIAEKHKVTAHCDCLTDMDNTIQKISECGVENEN